MINIGERPTDAAAKTMSYLASLSRTNHGRQILREEEAQSSDAAEDPTLTQ